MWEYRNEGAGDERGGDHGGLGEPNRSTGSLGARRLRLGDPPKEGSIRDEARELGGGLGEEAAVEGFVLAGLERSPGGGRRRTGEGRAVGGGRRRSGGFPGLRRHGGGRKPETRRRREAAPVRKSVLVGVRISPQKKIKNKK